MVFDYGHYLMFHKEIIWTLNETLFALQYDNEAFLWSKIGISVNLSSSIIELSRYFKVML